MSTHTHTRAVVVSLRLTQAAWDVCPLAVNLFAILGKKID